MESWGRHESSLPPSLLLYSAIARWLSWKLAPGQAITASQQTEPAPAWPLPSGMAQTISVSEIITDNTPCLLAGITAL